MAYELYYMPTTASLSVHWVMTYLHETHRIEYKTHLVSFPAKDQKKPWYLTLNPKGRVPTLILPNGQILTESSAILLYLAETHPEANLAPKIGDTTRAKFLELLIYVTNSLTPSLRDWVYAGRDGDDSPDSVKAVKDLSMDKITKAWDYLEGELVKSQSGWFAGCENPSIVDFLAVSLTAWKPFLREMAIERPTIKGLVEKMEKRSDWIKVREMEQEVEKTL